MTTPLPRNEMKDEDVVRQICEWCLDDEEWQKEFIKDSAAYPWRYFACVAEFGLSENVIELQLVVGDRGVKQFQRIPLTQFLMSPETVRVCIEKAEGRFVEGESAAQTTRMEWHLGRIASCEIDMCSRLDYYRTHFLSSGQK
jgi:hypothetical protein